MLAQETITVNGDISPADNPFEAGERGIPVGGSTVSFAGIDINGNPLDFDGSILMDETMTRIVGQRNYERAANVEIGRFATGQMLMSGGAVLRFGDLTIGGSAFLRNPNEANSLDFTNQDFGDGSTSANGYVEISGFGTTYNSHPLIVPTEFQPSATRPPGPGSDGRTTFAIPDAFDPDERFAGGVIGDADEITFINRVNTVANNDYDLYVGLSGIGELNITLGGRAEIHDGVFAGVGPAATGTINVSGSGSYLGAYGTKDLTGVAPDTGQQTLIGLHGHGQLNITEGGKVDSFNRAAIGAFDAAGIAGSAQAENFGTGYVRVEGIGSQWRILNPNTGQANDDDGSGLAIGQYRPIGANTTLDADISYEVLFNTSPEGIYEPSDASAILAIRDGGLVTVGDDIPAGTNTTDEPEDTDVRIGQSGALHLSGGRLIVGDRLDNDGLIRTGDFDAVTGSDYGDGRIEAASFLNSPFGEVRVRASEMLSIRSHGGQDDQEEITGADAGTPTTYFYANAGKIEVIGDQAVGKAELEFERDFDRADVGMPEDDRFKNLFFPAVPDPNEPLGTRNVIGQIKSQDANLFFRSNMLNEGYFDFIGGDNLVVGEVENAPTGSIFIVNESHVAFQDNVLNNGLILLNNESNVSFLDNFTDNGAFVDLNPASITVAGDYVGNGSLEFVIGGGPTGTDFTRMGIAGDATFGSTSTLAVDLISATGIVDGAIFDMITVGGSVTDNGLSLISLPTAPTGFFFLPQVFLTDDGNPNTILDNGADPSKLRLRVSAIDTTLVGADFNGDNVVDLDDLAIWQQFFGLQTGAVKELGDADGDGDVDARDLFIIQTQLGGAPFGFGAGNGSFNGAVPEPTSGALLLLSLVAGAGLRRRRQRTK